MAKVTIVGSAAVIKSALKYEDLVFIGKQNPKALTLMGGENGKEPIFTIAPAKSGSGQMNGFSAEFVKPADGSDAATITMNLEGVTGDVREYFADKYGAAMALLQKLEDALPAAVEAARAERKAVIDGITMAGQN